MRVIFTMPIKTRLLRPKWFTGKTFLFPAILLLSMSLTHHLMGNPDSSPSQGDFEKKENAIARMKEQNTSRISSWKLYTLDFLIPGYSAWKSDRLWHGSFISAGRVYSGILLVQYQAIAREYDSLALAARNAELYYGPGLVYYDPIHGGYRSKKKFELLADRHRFYSGLALTSHILIALYSAWITHKTIEERQQERIPEFRIRSDQQAVGLLFQGHGIGRTGLPFYKKDTPTNELFRITLLDF